MCLKRVQFQYTPSPYLVDDLSLHLVSSCSSWKGAFLHNHQWTRKIFSDIAIKEMRYWGLHWGLDSTRLVIWSPYSYIQIMIIRSFACFANINVRRNIFNYHLYIIALETQICDAPTKLNRCRTCKSQQIVFLRCQSRLWSSLSSLYQYVYMVHQSTLP